MFNDKVAHETRLITDGWAAYKGVEKLWFYWDWVNHQENFVKPGHPDVHTNTIEGILYVQMFSISN